MLDELLTGLNGGSVPTLDLIFLADYFHVTTDYLLGRSDEREEKSAGPLGQGPRSGIT